MYDYRSKFVRAQFAKGKQLLIEGSVDAVLTPIVVTSSDVDQFDYSFPVAKNWYPALNFIHIFTYSLLPLPIPFFAFYISCIAAPFTVRYELYSKRNGNAGATCASYIETWSPKLWMAFLATIFVLSFSLWFTVKLR